MKNFLINLFSKFLNGVILGIGLIVVLGAYSVYSAYITINTVNTGDKLQSSTFNTLIANIDDLNVRIGAIFAPWIKNGSHIYFNTGNVGIGNNNPQANLDVSGTVKIFGNRTNISLGTIYQASSDGFVSAFGRTDGASGLLYLRLMGGGTTPPTSELGVTYSYNNGTTRLGNFQLMVPIKKGEYYQLLCNGLTSCPSPFFIGGFNAYFIQLGN